MVMKKKSEWYHRSPPPPSPISYQWQMKGMQQEERKALLRGVGVGISTVQKKHTHTHSLQVKSLYISRAGVGTDHLKRLKIKDQLQNGWKEQLSMLKAEALFGGGLGTCSPHRNFENLCSKWGHLGLFYIIHNFFSPLKIQKRFETLWLDKDIKIGELSIILLYPFIGSSSWQNTRRYEIYSSSVEQKSLLCRKTVWFFLAHLQLF